MLIVSHFAQNFNGILRHWLEDHFFNYNAFGISRRLTTGPVRAGRKCPEEESYPDGTAMDGAVTHLCIGLTFHA